MKISCRIIEDILPLYADEVCSEESRALVNEHVAQCEKCRTVIPRCFISRTNRALLRHSRAKLSQ